ncbi:MAG TPA: homocysteine S-methyltransferase family protein [Bacteroidia bacterium]|nr:homocysteine S-methyltransferase family protein [Bacteroidia bacterium]
MTINKLTLPHQTGDLFLTDGGIETTLIFRDGFELPYFAAFDLLKDAKGYNGIREYYLPYLKIARDFKTRFILESPTWRANRDWIKKVGYPASAIAEINKKAIQFLVDLRKEFEDQLTEIIISGCIGPRGDGYKAENKMTVSEASAYHAEQAEAFSHTPADMITAITMNYVEEAIGIANAAAAVKLPAVISFTVETDGKLPGGMTLKEAVEKVDESATGPPLYYMINCAHPTHFFNELQKGGQEHWTSRIKGIRANASCKSHAELDEATELDSGNPEELGIEHKKLKKLFNQLNVFGGCCGTDERHILEIVKQVHN